MRTYREYVIRCKTCNEQLACFSQTYEDLIANGLTIEETLNNLGIMLPCSRAAMMNPTYVNFNMENRDVVEGLRSVESVEDDFVYRDPAKESTTNPIFASCLPPNVGNIPTIQPVTQRVVAEPAVPVMRIGAMPGMQTLTTLQPVRPPTAPLTLQRLTGGTPIHVARPPQAQLQVIAPIIAMDLSVLAQPLGVGIPVQALEAETEFKEPTIPGVPTINHNPKLAPVTIHVGAGKYCTVLNGRTYLAQ